MHPTYRYVIIGILAIACLPHALLDSQFVYSCKYVCTSQNDNHGIAISMVNCTRYSASQHENKSLFSSYRAVIKSQ